MGEGFISSPTYKMPDPADIVGEKILKGEIEIIPLIVFYVRKSIAESS